MSQLAVTAVENWQKEARLGLYYRRIIGIGDRRCGAVNGTNLLELSEKHQLSLSKRHSRLCRTWLSDVRTTT